MNDLPVFDLEFTKDAAWREAREEAWERVVYYKFETSPDEVVDVAEKVFFDGDIEVTEQNGFKRMDILRLFPLKTEAVWDALIPRYEQKRHENSALGRIIHQLSSSFYLWGWELGEELRFWKYVGLEHYQPTVYPEVLHGLPKRRDYPIFVDSSMDVSRMSIPIYRRLNGEDDTHNLTILIRWEYYLECLQSKRYIEDFKVDKYRGSVLKSFLKALIANPEVPDFVQPYAQEYIVMRTGILGAFESKSLPALLQKVWNELMIEEKGV